MGKKKQKMLFSIVYQVPFETDTDLYETEDPNEMAAIDQKEANEDPFEAFLAMASLPGGKFRAKVTPVESVEQKTGLELKG